MATLKPSIAERRFTVVFALLTVATGINWAVGRQLYPLYYYVIGGALFLVTAMVAVSGVVLLRRAHTEDRGPSSDEKAVN